MVFELPEELVDYLAELDDLSRGSGHRKSLGR
jgi:hypothetical protein